MVITAIIFLGIVSSIFIGTSLATVLIHKDKIIPIYKNLILFSFIPTYAMIIFGVMGLIEIKNQKEVKKEKFEIVKETLYKKIE
jgi:hypothetical protein